MSLFHLPVELVMLIFDQIAVSRTISRVMRIRLVNAQFKQFIDNSVFRFRLLSTFDRDHYFLKSTRRLSVRDCFPYIHSYLMYQVLRAQPSISPHLRRVYLAARALGELERLDSLMRLAISVYVYPLLGESTAKPEDLGECDDADVEADVFVAAVYLGRKDYIAPRMTANNLPCHEHPNANLVYSTIFGSAFAAATMQGNVEMIKLLLLCTPQYRDAGTLPDRILDDMLIDNSCHINETSTYNRQALLDFVLDMISNESKSGKKMRSQPFILALRHALFPNQFERAAALMPSSYLMDSEDLLITNVEQGNVDMVRYWLDKGVSPNIDPWDSTPLIKAIKGSNDTIIRMLLDSGSDLSYKTRYKNNALMTAVWKGRIAIANILLDRGVNPNEGYPPPIVIAIFKENLSMFRLLRDHGARLDTPDTGGLAMAIADSHGLSSMQTILMHEGVSQDVIRPSRAGSCWTYDSLWVGYTRRENEQRRPKLKLWRR
ncbi:ankyrin [Xylaria curta]|nr:ankyrin [Xylaria curta]